MKNVLFVGSHSEDLAAEIKAGFKDDTSVIFAEKTKDGRDRIAEMSDIDVTFINVSSLEVEEGVIHALGYWNDLSSLVQDSLCSKIPVVITSSGSESPIAEALANVIGSFAGKENVIASGKLIPNTLTAFLNKSLETASFKKSDDSTDDASVTDKDDSAKKEAGTEVTA